MKDSRHPLAAGNPAACTVVVPVNAQADLGTVGRLLGDLLPWNDADRGEVLLVVNNFDGAEPAAVGELRLRGARVISEGKLSVRHGEVPPVAARALGARHSPPGLLVHFDADVRVPDAAALLQWYQDRFASGIGVAATGIGFHEIPPGLSIRARIVSHQAARWLKRVVLRTPVTRGSNYATDRDLFLEAYDRGMIADELNVGPALTALGARYAYSGDARLRVLTSARRFRGGWLRLVRYLWYRLRYNLRSLPVDEQAAERTGRWKDPRDRWDRPA